MKTIAIVGSIGSGKSTVRECFNHIHVDGLNITTINLDTFAKSCGTSKTVGTIANMFGVGVLNNSGTIDSNYVLNEIFPYDDRYHMLNNYMLRTHIGPFIKTTIAQHRQQGTHLLVFEGAGLIHSPELLALFDDVLVTSCHKQECMARVRLRKKYTPTQIEWLYRRTTIPYTLDLPATFVDTETSDHLTLQYTIELYVYSLLLGTDMTPIEYIQTKYGSNVVKFDTSSDMYTQAYHNIDHMTSVLVNAILTVRFSPGTVTAIDKLSLFIACIWHDAVYEPGSDMNELNSVVAMKRIYDYQGQSGRIWTELTTQAGELIKLTGIIWFNIDKELSLIQHTMIASDLAIFNYSAEAILEYEKRIRKEYVGVKCDDYYAGRCAFLQQKLIPLLSKHFNQSMVDNATNLLNYLKQHLPATNPMVEHNVPTISNIVENVAVYAGSFDPLHIGHLDIINEALKTFDKVILLRCINGNKSNDNRCEIPVGRLPVNCIYIPWNKSFVDFLLNYVPVQPCKLTIIRGVRNGTDLQYENDYIRHVKAMFNSKQQQGEKIPSFPGVLYIPALSEHAHISSSSIKAILPFDTEYGNSLIV